MTVCENNSGSTDQVTLEEMIKRKTEFDHKYDSVQNYLHKLWGNEKVYAPCTENKCSFLSNLYYTWIEDKVKLAASEKLTNEFLPEPLKQMRTRNCG